MKKQDMEYLSCQEFTPLPDEYPQSMEHGGTSIQTSDSLSKGGHKSILKRMMQMMTVFTVVTYTAATVADAQPIARPDLPKTIIAVQNGVAYLLESDLPETEEQAVPEDESVAGQEEDFQKDTIQQTDSDSVIETMPEEESESETEPETEMEPEPETEAESESASEPESESEERQVCSTCGGTGDCGECKGGGYLGPGYAVSCPRCHGSGKETCPYCDAAGNSTAHEGTCDFPHCMGSHTYACTICGGGSRAVTCESCGGTGNCKTCGGTGYAP